jgi:hypothetical protein
MNHLDRGFELLADLGIWTIKVLLTVLFAPIFFLGWLSNKIQPCNCGKGPIWRCTRHRRESNVRMSMGDHH